MPHIHEKIDFTVEVFVVYNKKVLLRKHDKYGIWLSVGGHIDLGEDPIEAAYREVKEETGLDVHLVGEVPVFEGEGYMELLAPRFMNRNRINNTHEHVTLTYFARSESDEVIPEYESDRSEDWAWLTREEIIEHTELKEDIRHYALAALDALS